MIFRLENISETDLELVLKWRNTEAIRKCMVNDQIISWEDHCKWFENLCNKSDREFLIFSINGEKTGVVSFVDIDLDNKKCHWGFYIGNVKAPHGAGSIMAYHALNYIFGKYGLHNINSEVFQFNKTSLIFHEKLRFKKMGVLEDELLREDHYQNLVLYSLFRDDWENSRECIYEKALEKVKLAYE